MFNDNVTQTYNFQDASQEIIIMLLGAFLLGCLLTWLLNKLYNNDYSAENNSYRYEEKQMEMEPLKQSSVGAVDTTSDVRIVKQPTNPISKTIPRNDDLLKISGIDTYALTELKKQGITSFTSLRDIKSEDLKSFQQKRETHKRVIETWPHQANLAAKGDWTKLKDYQDFIQRAQIASKNTNTPERKTSVAKHTDDLKLVKGIDSEIETILNKREIYSFKHLSQVDSDLLKNHIVDAKPKLNDVDMETWSHQAAMAEKGQWEELKIYQEFMDSDDDENSHSGIKNTTVSPLKSNLNLDTNSNNEKPLNIQSQDENLSDHDDLKKIEGVGPKIEEILNNGGIYTFSQLYNSDRNRLRKLLDDAGNQYKMHDPSSWPHQAGMANRAEWQELKSYQGSITNEQKAALNDDNIETANTRSYVAKDKLSIVPNTPLKDELRKIEGIGPKIEELLNKAGIETFEQLSKKTRDSIKELLNEAGPQFRMHEPESWPHQAKLAANGEWKELEKYQDFLLGGRE